MPFSAEEKKALLALKGVGATVIARLEQIGIESFAQLAWQDTQDVVSRIAMALETTCWKNSPQARAAIASAIELARARQNERQVGLA